MSESTGKSHDACHDWLEFDPELGDVPRYRGTFWLDDAYFWFPLLEHATGAKELPRGLKTRVIPGWGGEISYDRGANRVSMPIGIACRSHNEYVKELKIRAAAVEASQFRIADLYALYALYKNWDVERKPWLFSVVFRSALEYKFKDLCRYIDRELDRDAPFAGDFVDELLAYATRSRFLSPKKRQNLRAIIQQEPFEQEHQDDEAQQAYDVALSFAGEDRHRAERIAQSLAARGVRVFYDKHEEASLWGKNLYEYLAEVYERRARFCIMIISEYYAEKRWTTHERRSAQARAFRENREYILPVRVDDTVIPGLHETVGYLDLRIVDETYIADVAIRKLGDLTKR